MGGIGAASIVVLIIGLVAGIILTLAAHFLAVPVDERVAQVREALPGANCGACGFAGCDEYAQKLVEEGAATNLCPPGGADTAAKIAALLGVSAEDVVPTMAVVHCNGTCENTTYSVDYQGPKSCKACNALFQGRGNCSYSCLGYGDCVQVCQYGAIYIQDGVAVVDPDLCVGCNMCVTECPKAIISIVPKSSQVFVRCSSQDKGAVARKLCATACIACKLCVRKCDTGAITVENNLARIDPEKCTNCGACVEVCTTNSIFSWMPVAVSVEAEAAPEA